MQFSPQERISFGIIIDEAPDWSKKIALCDYQRLPVWHLLGRAFPHSVGLAGRMDRLLG